MLAAAALSLPVAGGVALAQEGGDAALDPTTPTTPAPTTPTGPLPTLTGPATQATVAWQAPASITEDERVKLTVTGQLNGQATIHAALMRDVAACPSSPLYPTQSVAGGRLAVSAPATPPVVGQPNLGTIDHASTLSTPSGGAVRLCAWIVASPSTGEASTLARLDQPYAIISRSSTVSGVIPPLVRSAEHFSVTLSGTTAGTGRRILVMAEPNRGQRCGELRKAASGKRPLQGVYGIPSGTYTKALRLRYRSKTAGQMLLCFQIVEVKDRVPEGELSAVQTVAESLKCERTQLTIAGRRSDLTTIRRRRDAAKARVDDAKRRAAPIKRRYVTKKRASDRRVAAARKRLARAKSSAARKQASRRLAATKRTEARRMRTARKPLTAIEATIRRNDRTYKQYRRGAVLLDQTITRTKKDLKKYCAKP